MLERLHLTSRRFVVINPHLRVLGINPHLLRFRFSLFSGERLAVAGSPSYNYVSKLTNIEL